MPMKHYHKCSASNSASIHWRQDIWLFNVKIYLGVQIHRYEDLSTTPLPLDFPPWRYWHLSVAPLRHPVSPSQAAIRTAGPARCAHVTICQPGHLRTCFTGPARRLLTTGTADLRRMARAALGLGQPATEKFLGPAGPAPAPPHPPATEGEHPRHVPAAAPRLAPVRPVAGGGRWVRGGDVRAEPP
jgi:hypothetical protein